MPIDDPETEVRLSEAAHGDEGALRWLLERYRARLKRMIEIRLDDRLSPRLDASDVVQETLVDAASKMNDYVRDRPLPFYPWLHRLAAERLAQAHRHHLLAARRSAGLERPIDRLGLDGTEWRLADALVANGTSPSRHLIRQEEREQVAQALGELPVSDREVLVLRYVDQLAFDEIAAILGIGTGAARVRHFRALQKLGPILEGPDEARKP